VAVLTRIRTPHDRFKKNRLSSVEKSQINYSTPAAHLHFLNLAFPLALLYSKAIKQEVNMSTATITSKGQITIPAIVRAALGVEAGDRVEFVQVEPGRFELFASTQPVSALKGLVRKPSTPVTIEIMNETIAERGASSK
jgi:antitoxin PrlF